MSAELNKLSNPLELLLDKYNLVDYVPHGSLYILPNGKIMDLGNSGFGHSEVGELLYLNGLDPDYQEGRSSQLLKNLGWIRANTNLKFIDLPLILPSAEQFETLLKILDYMKTDYQVTANNQYKIYKDRTPEEVIKLIRRYYASGKLYENLTK